MSAPGSRRTRRALAAALAAAVVLAGGALLAPRPPSLGAASGDRALLERVRAELGAGGAAHDRVSVAVVERGPEPDAAWIVRSADFGAGPDTEYEIGSLTKTMTAALYVDAIERGELRADTRLGELLELGDSPAAGVTLESLATHTSGLPRLPLSPGVLIGSIVSNTRASNPYRWELPQLLEQARGVGLSDPGTVAYSNLGAALLGQAVAAAAGGDYASLVEERLLRPLALGNTRVPLTPAELGANAPTGFTAGGRPAEAWAMRAYAPAGGVRSTSADLLRYARALLAGTAPGVGALEPRADAGDGMRIGAAWFETADGITWHNGGTGGFSSFLGLDRAGQRAVIVLSSTASSVDELGMGLLTAPLAPPESGAGDER